MAQNPLTHVHACACVATDALTCIQVRYGHSSFDPDNSDLPCECFCHDQGQDDDPDNMILVS